MMYEPDDLFCNTLQECYSLLL